MGEATGRRWKSRRVAILPWRARIWSLRGRSPKPPSAMRPTRRSRGMPGPTPEAICDWKDVRLGGWPVNSAMKRTVLRVNEDVTKARPMVDKGSRGRRARRPRAVARRAVHAVTRA